MNSTSDLRVGHAARAGSTRTGLAITGLVGTLAAMTATTVVAALARAAGVDFEIPDGGKAITLPAFAVVTGFFSLAGIVLAAGFLRWAAQPAPSFVRTAVALTVLSAVPPLLTGADAATVVALLGLHLVAAAVMIPILGRSLRLRSRSLIDGGAERDA